MKRIFIFASIALVSLIAPHLYSSQSTSQSRPDADDKITLVSSDSVDFEVPKSIKEESGVINNCLSDAKTQSSIPLYKVDARTLCHWFEFRTDKASVKNLSIEDLVALFIASDYLDIKSLRKPVIDALIKNLTWDANEINKVMGDESAISDFDKMRIIERFVGRGSEQVTLPTVLSSEAVSIDQQFDWTCEELRVVYQSLPERFQLNFIMEIMRVHQILLAQVIDKPFDIHRKNCKAQDLDPMQTAWRKPEPTAEDRRVFANIVQLIGAPSYEILSQVLKAEYSTE